VGRGATSAFSFDFHVSEGRGGPRDAHGYFRATGTPPSNTFIAVQGPATCVDVQGNRVGFLYPIAPGSRPAAFVGQNVLITAVDNGPGRQGTIGLLPVGIDPGSCAPNASTLPVTSGEVTVHDHR